MYFVPEGQHDRSQARSAWDSAHPQKSRPVRYGMIRVRVRTDSKIGYLACLKKHDVHFDEKYLWDQLRLIIPYPTGRFFRGDLSQALRAWLRSCCLSGTKAIRPSKGLALS